MKTIRNVLASSAVAFVLIYVFLWWFGAGYLLNHLIHPDTWPQMSTRDIRLSHAMRVATGDRIPPVHPGGMTWRTTAPGFEVAELPVLTATEEIDRLYLVRIDPALYRFEVRTGGDRYHTIKDWEKALPDAALIVNGSFFAKHNVPDTPLLSNGRAMGPTTYDAQAGAFVADARHASVVDLSTGGDWRTAFIGADNAMVAYPLLVGTDGQNHVKVKSNWLANRTFVAQDGDGRIVIGSTKEAFFSLDRQAEFLRTALPGLIILNLDGGPLACQSVRSGGVHRLHIARWEAQIEGDRAKVLHWQVGLSDMPIILVATPKAKEGL